MTDSRYLFPKPAPIMLKLNWQAKKKATPGISYQHFPLFMPQV